MAEIHVIVQRLVTLREKKGWTRYRLAKEAIIAFNTLKNIETGDSSPTLDMLQRICDALGATWEDVIKPVE